MRTSAGALKLARRSLAGGRRVLNDLKGLPQQAFHHASSQKLFKEGLTTTAYHDGATAMRGGGVEELLQRTL